VQYICFYSLIVSTFDYPLNLLIKSTNFQMAYLEDWDLLEGDHYTSLNGVIKDLEACTLRLPVTGSAKV
jgi:uncharacterized protein DUF566